MRDLRSKSKSLKKSKQRAFISLKSAKADLKEIKETNESLIESLHATKVIIASSYSADKKRQIEEIDTESRRLKSDIRQKSKRVKAASRAFEKASLRYSQSIKAINTERLVRRHTEEPYYERAFD